MSGILPISKNISFILIFNTLKHLKVEAEAWKPVCDNEGAIFLYQFIKGNKVVSQFDATEVKVILKEGEGDVEAIIDALTPKTEMPVVEKRKRGRPRKK